MTGAMPSMPDTAASDPGLVDGLGAARAVREQSTTTNEMTRSISGAARGSADVLTGGV